MSLFGRGYIWPDNAGTLTSLTAAFVNSAVEFELSSEKHLVCLAEIPAGAVDDIALLVRADVSFDGGTTWIQGYDHVEIPGFTAAVGAATFYPFYLKFPTHCVGRIAARDMLADADTTCRIWGNVRHFDPEDWKRLRSLVIESATYNGVLAWHDGAGAADALGAGALAYGPAAGTQEVPVGDANEVEIWCVTTGGPPTSIQLQIEESLDEGTTYAPLPVINTVIAGVDQEMPMLIDLQSAAGTLANGTYVTRRITVHPGSWIRMSAQRVGAAVNLLAHYRFYRTGF
jgi:hypothetical protein